MTKNADQMQESRNEMMIVRVDLGMLHYCPVAPGIAFSLLFSASVVMGYAVYEASPLGGSLFLSIAVFIAGAIATFVVFQLAAQALTRWNSHDLRREISRSLPPWFLLAAWAIILACWIPCLLAYWPGVFAYDLPKQTAQVFTGDYNTDHPILHTLLWNACLQVASSIGLEAVTLYAIIQMVFLSFAFATVVRFFQRRNLPLWLIALSLVFFALHPANALMAINPTKDVPLAAFFVLFTLEIVRLSSSPSSYLSKRKNIVRIVLFGLACCLFRNNMPYALLLAVVVAFAFARGFRLRMLAIFAVPAIVAILFAGPILGSMGITHVRNWEAFSVPMQQVVYAAKKHDVDIDQSLKSTSP